MARKTKQKGVPGGKLQLKWVRSAICTPVKHKLVVKGLIGGPEGIYSSSALATILANFFISGSWDTPSEKNDVMC